MLIIQKGTTELIRLEDNGDVAFTPYHQDTEADGVATAGEIHMTWDGSEQLDSAVVGSDRVIRLKRRLHTNAILPGVGLQFRHGVNPRAELHPSGDLYLLGDRLGMLPNPAVAGPSTATTVIYAAPGLDYSASGVQPQYIAFETPTTDFDTRTIDISDFANLPSFPAWPFTNANVPINGLARIPNGPGPFPLALFVHGNHSPNENSTPGYVYLLDLLASHGIIAASVDCNFLNGANWGENDGRAIVHLEHVRQFQIWNATVGHPLQGRVDLSRIMIVGHSRGGEGVGHASYFNGLTSVVPDPGDPPIALDGSTGLGPYGFSLRAVVSIAPTDLQYTPVGGAQPVEDDYFIVHGSRDGDVWPFSGYSTYDRAQPIDLGNPTQPANGRKALLWVIGANHNFFNSVWSSEGSPTLSRAEQENVAKVWIGAIAQSRLLSRSPYEELIRDHRVAWTNGWIPNTIELVSQYQDPERLFLDHYEHGNTATPSPPVTGTISTAGMLSAEMQFNTGVWTDLFQETNGLMLTWNVAGGRYTVTANAGSITRGVLQRLVMRVGQSDDPLNNQATLQDFELILSDSTHSHALQASTLADMPFPAELHTGVRRSVMQTFRVPLKVFVDNGINVDDIRTIELSFDRPQVGTATVTGELYLDELQLSE